MKKVLLLMNLAFLGFNSSYGQETPKPEFLGTYAVVKGNLVEFIKDSAVNISGVGDLMNPNLGIRKLRGPWLADTTTYFISYGSKSKLLLSKLAWKSTVQSKNSMTGAVTEVQANMYVVDGNIELKVAPIQGMENCYKLIPSKPLKQGYYCLHTGRLTSQDAMSMTIEANANKDAFDFTITNGFMISGDLKNCDIDKGEYISPSYYGLYFIENKKYVMIPVSKGKNFVEYGTLEERKEGVLNLSSVVLNSSALEKTFVSYSSEDIRQGIRVSMSTADFKDMIPEKMYFSKLKQIDVDTRSKREIKKLIPEIIQKVWIEDYQIAYYVDFSFYNYPRIARLYTVNPLEPGVYALHNGVLKGQSLSFGLSNVVYTFTVK